jgi:hypothetical protein
MATLHEKSINKLARHGFYTHVQCDLSCVEEIITLTFHFVLDAHKDAGVDIYFVII